MLGLFSKLSYTSPVLALKKRKPQQQKRYPTGNKHSAECTCDELGNKDITLQASLSDTLPPWRKNIN